MKRPKVPSARPVALSWHENTRWVSPLPPQRSMMSFTWAVFLKIKLMPCERSGDQNSLLFQDFEGWAVVAAALLLWWRPTSLFVIEVIMCSIWLCTSWRDGRTPIKRFIKCVMLVLHTEISAERCGGLPFSLLVMPQEAYTLEWTTWTQRTDALCFWTFCFKAIVKTCEICHLHRQTLQYSHLQAQY